MIYSIIGNSDVSLTKYHIYLQNTTGSDGGTFPEVLTSIAETENVNPLYAFSVAIVLLQYHTDTGNFINPDTIKATGNDNTIETQMLGLIQYLKGMATTIPLRKPCVTTLYKNLVDTRTIGLAPSILNLDGDLFIGKHYDTSKYHSREAADEAEDSFPYWVINVVKDVTNAEELRKPKKNVVYQLPYYVQNISNEAIPIYNKIDPASREVIGNIPPTGVEIVTEIKCGRGKLISSKSAYIDLDERKILPFKHFESISEIEPDYTMNNLPEVPFTVEVNTNCLIVPGYGLNGHYFGKETNETKFVIHEIFLNHYGITKIDDEEYYIGLNPTFIHIYNEPKTDNDTVNAIEVNYDKPVEKMVVPAPNYEIRIPCTSPDDAEIAKSLIKDRTSIDVDLLREKGNYFLIKEYHDETNKKAISDRKTIMTRTGLKVQLISYQ